jgi:hypothetical protein
VPFEGGVVICAVYPDGNPDRPNTCNPPGMDNYSSIDGHTDVQVEFTVKVPLGVRLSGALLRGDIQAASLTADVDANTLDGGITISTTGATQANTLHGSISAVIGSVNWSGLRRFDTEDGNIDLQIPADANVSVKASTLSGAVVSDFPLMTRVTPFGPSSVVSGILGSDGRSLSLSTLHGNIALRQGRASSQ